MAQVKEIDDSPFISVGNIVYQETVTVRLYFIVTYFEHLDNKDKYCLVSLLNGSVVYSETNLSDLLVKAKCKYFSGKLTINN